MIDENLKKFMEQVKERKEWLLYLQKKADVWELRAIKKRLENENREIEKEKGEYVCSNYWYYAKKIIEKNNEELQIINDKLRKLKGVA